MLILLLVLILSVYIYFVAKNKELSVLEVKN